MYKRSILQFKGSHRGYYNGKEAKVSSCKGAMEHFSLTKTQFKLAKEKLATYHNDKERGPIYKRMMAHNERYYLHWMRKNPVMCPSLQMNRADSGH